MRIINRIPSAAPIPIPALAPVERPVELEARFGSGDAELVATAEEVDVAPGAAEVAPTIAGAVEVVDEVVVFPTVEVAVAK